MDKEAFSSSGIRPIVDRVVIVEGEADIAGRLAPSLQEAGFAALTVISGGQAIVEATRSHPAVVVMGRALPDMRGAELCQRLRADVASGDVGLMVLASDDDEQDRVSSFEAGADDYVAKPFRMEEVVMRVRALARCANERRRSRALKQSGDRFRWRGLEVDPLAQRAYVNGGELPLSHLEIKMLLLFFENPESLFTRSRLLKALWGLSDSASTRTVDKQVRRLRDRLGEFGGVIETAHGLGYKLRDAG